MSEEKIENKEKSYCKLLSIENAGSFGVNPYTTLTFDTNGKTEKHSLSDGKLLSLIKTAEDNSFKPC
jgi:hypothetical protein